MTAAVAVRPPEIPSRSPTPPPSLSLNTSLSGSPAAVPNKHIPFCSPGPTPYGLPSPPASPPSQQSSPTSSCLLYPPDPNTKLPSSSPPVYRINAPTVALALDQQSNRTLAKPHDLFPWLHGLHPQNSLQLAFFTSRSPRNASRRDACRPPFGHRYVTLVKTGGDLSVSRLKGALAPDELLSPLGSGSDLAPCFQDVDPRCGFSVRNFHIQVCKAAMMSDIIVYGDDSTPREDVEKLAGLFAQAQINLREEWLGDDIYASDGEDGGTNIEDYNTFVVTDPFSAFEEYHPSIVASSSTGSLTGAVLDFLSQERIEMSDLSAASELSPNVFLGHTPESACMDANSPNCEVPPDGPEHAIMIEASDMASMPDQDSLTEISHFLDEKSRCRERAVANLEVPSSGSYLVSDRGEICAQTVDRLIKLCRWIWDQSHTPSEPTFLPLTDSEGDTSMSDPESPPRRILLHCADGYTETTLLGIAYYMYSHNVPFHTALVDLHVTRARNFFAYPSDKAFLLAVESRLLSSSSARPTSASTEETHHCHSPKQIPPSLVDRPDWLSRMDGSLPSRILPYLYLGNLQHATNPSLLAAMGINRVLSVGEPVHYLPDTPYVSSFKLMRIDGVQDNGVDALRPQFDRCLDFIDDAEREVVDTCGERGKVLVHCRVGVSRSATIVIAAVMKKMGLSFPRAYCFVRARRLNVIVQPHLRFVYELLGWEEELGRFNGSGIGDDDRNGSTWKGRELEWPLVAREISAMNRPYCRQ